MKRRKSLADTLAAELRRNYGNSSSKARKHSKASNRAGRRPYSNN